MPSTIQPIIVTADAEPMIRFYTTLFDAKETNRVPEDGPLFYLMLQIGDSDLGIVSEATDAPVGRIVLSFDVPDVDALLGPVEELGGTVLGPSNDMPWGQRVAHVEDPDGNTINLTQNLGGPAA